MEEITNQEEQANLIEEIKQGYTTREIAEKNGVTIKLIRNRMSEIDKKILKQAIQEGKERRKQNKQEIEERWSRKKQEIWNKEKQKREERKKKEKQEKKERQEQEKREKQEKQEKEKREKQEKILEYIKQGYTQTQIAKIMGVSSATISCAVKKIDEQELTKSKQEGNEKKQERKQEEREKSQENLVEKIKQGYTTKEIADPKGLKVGTIWNQMEKIDKVSLEQAKQERKAIREEKQYGEKQEERKKKNKTRREKILEYMKQGYTQTEIAKMMGVSSATISLEIKKIDEKEVIKVKQARKEVIEERRQKQREESLKLKQQGYNEEQIAKIMGVSQHTISVWINEIHKQEVVEGKRRAEIMEKIQQRKLTKEDVKKYRKDLQSMGNKVGLEDIEVLLKAYIKINETEKAIEFIKDIIENREIEQSDIERLEQIQRKLATVKRIQTARNELKQGKTISQVMSITGFDEVQVKKIKSEMEKNLEQEL